MKFSVVLLITLGLFCFGLSGCNENARQKTGTANSAPGVAPAGEAKEASVQEKLAHRNFVLKSVDGSPAPAFPKPIEIGFGEAFTVSGQVCNRFSGKGEMEGDTLFVKQVASTRMMCPGREMSQLENGLFKMLAEGAKVAFDGKTLTLSGQGHTLVYDLRDLVQ